MFLKMAVEYRESFKNVQPLVPDGFDWDSLISRRGEELLEQYERILEKLKHEPGLVGELFSTASNRFRDPEKLRDLIELIDNGDWTKMN